MTRDALHHFTIRNRAQTRAWMRRHTDASKWAAEFVRLHGGDEGLMLSWFANAIEHGRGPDPLRAALTAADPAPAGATGDVDAAWKNLYERFDREHAHTDAYLFVQDIIREHRPLIEAAIRSAIYAEDVAEYERPLRAAPATPLEPLEGPEAEFVTAAATDMLRRMHDGTRRGWGTTWRYDYPDKTVSERLGRAVSHLRAAFAQFRSGSVGVDEVRKRAADVANQAFMLADPDRLQDRLQARPTDTEPSGEETP